MHVVLLSFPMFVWTFSILVRILSDLNKDSEDILRTLEGWRQEKGTKSWGRSLIAFVIAVMKLVVNATITVTDGLLRRRERAAFWEFLSCTNFYAILVWAIQATVMGNGGASGDFQPITDLTRPGQLLPFLCGLVALASMFAI